MAQFFSTIVYVSFDKKEFNTYAEMKHYEIMEQRKIKKLEFEKNSNVEKNQKIVKF